MTDTNRLREAEELVAFIANGPPPTDEYGECIWCGAPTRTGKHGQVTGEHDTDCPYIEAVQHMKKYKHADEQYTEHPDGEDWKDWRQA